MDLKELFYGNEFKIKNLKLTSSLETQGFFGKVEKEAKIEDVVIESGTISNSSAVKLGAIAGENNGTIKGCNNKVQVTGKAKIGGLVGENLGVIDGCENSGEIKGQDKLGGISGVSNGKSEIKNCVNSGSVTLSNSSALSDDLSYAKEDKWTSVGGIVGNIEKECKLNMCKNIGNVTGQSNVGGIVGFAKGNIEKCWNIASITGSRHGTGGIVGRLYEGIILKCKNFGKVEGYCFSGGIVGGCCGYFENISECGNSGAVMSTGPISSTHGWAGGIIGYTESKEFETVLQYSYNIGNVSCYYGGCGGLVGGRKRSIDEYNGDGWIDIRECYNAGILDGKEEWTGWYVGVVITAYLSGKTGCRTDMQLFGKVTTANQSTGYFKYTNDVGYDLKYLNSSYFMADKNNKNNGCPILKWEENFEF